MQYYELDIGTTGTDTGNGYAVKPYNDGKKIERGAARIVYTRVDLNKNGTYAFDAIKVYAVPMDDYDRNAEVLDSRRFEISEWDDDFAKGTMTCAEDSIMYFSILKNKGWHIYVDGEKVQKIKDVNISFTGALLPAGEHEVELRYAYPYKNILFASTAAGLLLTAVMMIIYLRKKKLRKGQGL